jgi:hypothetical protein
MALAQYLSTLAPAQTQSEAVPGWPMHIRLYDDRTVAFDVGSPAVGVVNLQRMLGRPMLYVRIQQNCNKCVQGLKKIVEAYMEAPAPPPGLRLMGFPPERWVLQDQPGRV